jgi:hypothetical protein
MMNEHHSAWHDHHQKLLQNRAKKEDKNEGRNENEN